MQLERAWRRDHDNPKARFLDSMLLQTCRRHKHLATQANKMKANEHAVNRCSELHAINYIDTKQ